MIKINGLVKKYGDRVAVNEVSFCVQEGEIFGLLGPNGAGKTTTISILATLLPPDQGQVTIGGRTIHRGLRHLVDRHDRRDLSIFQIGFRFTQRRLTNDLPLSVPLCSYL